MAKSIKLMYYAELDNPDEGVNGINTCTFFNLFLDRYCDIGQTDIDDNIARFNEAINPSLPLAVYCRKQEKYQDFMAEANFPISEATIVATGTKHALQCVNIVPAWHK